MAALSSPVIEALPTCADPTKKKLPRFSDVIDSKELSFLDENDRQWFITISHEYSDLCGFVSKQNNRLLRLSEAIKRGQKEYEEEVKETLNELFPDGEESRFVRFKKKCDEFLGEIQNNPTYEYVKKVGFGSWVAGLVSGSSAVALVNDVEAVACEVRKFRDNSMKIAAKVEGVEGHNALKVQDIDYELLEKSCGKVKKLEEEFFGHSQQITGLSSKVSQSFSGVSDSKERTFLDAEDRRRFMEISHEYTDLREFVSKQNDRLLRLSEAIKRGHKEYEEVEETLKELSCDGEESCFGRFEKKCDEFLDGAQNNPKYEFKKAGFGSWVAGLVSGSSAVALVKDVEALVCEVRKFRYDYLEIAAKVEEVEGHNAVKAQDIDYELLEKSCGEVKTVLEATAKAEK